MNAIDLCERGLVPDVLARAGMRRLMATRLNLTGALAGARPLPSDEIWLRDTDIVLVPKMPIQRLSEFVDLYFTRTIYSVFKIQGYEFFFDDFSTIVE